jgi:hypothetical protein
VELAARQIHCDRRARDAHGPPSPELAAGDREDVCPECQNRPGRLGVGDESVRVQEAPSRMLPTHESLGSRHGKGSSVENGLVVDDELLWVE